MTVTIRRKQKQPQVTAALPDKATVCSFCRHPYWFPCHGENVNCLNRSFVLARRAREASQP